LQAVGIQIVPQPLPGSVIYTPSGAGSGDFDILDLSVDTSGDPADLVDAYRCGGLDNWTGFCSKKVDALLTAAGREFEAGSRIEDYATADKILSESVPAFPLYAPPHALARKSTLLGIGAGPALLFENWHWRR
jgi:ABC-type transport system substrate-binding protein